MPIDRNLIYDKDNATISRLHEKYSEHEAIVALHAVIHVKPDGVKHTSSRQEKKYPSY